MKNYNKEMAEESLGMAVKGLAILFVLSALYDLFFEVGGGVKGVLLIITLSFIFLSIFGKKTK